MARKIAKKAKKAKKTAVKEKEMQIEYNGFEITPEIIKEHGFKEGEYENILKIMGRTPTYVELGIFSAMGRNTAATSTARRP